MDDLIAFLRARLDEREARAGLHDRDCVTLDDTFEGTTDPCDCPEPAFVLADVAAKRRILDFIDEDPPFLDGGSWAYLDPILRLLALPYADHPDYRQEWRR